MKNVLSFIYLLMGFLVGFLVGATPSGGNGFPIQRLVVFLIAIVVIALYIWFESSSHGRHLANWEGQRKKGKLLFVVSHYLLARAIPVLLIFITPVVLRMNLVIESVNVVLLTVFIGLVAYTFLGLQEWANCQADFSSKSMKKAAELAKGMSSDSAGGGA